MEGRVMGNALDWLNVPVTFSCLGVRCEVPCSRGYNTGLSLVVIKFCKFRDDYGRVKCLHRVEDENMLWL